MIETRGTPCLSRSSDAISGNFSPFSRFWRCSASWSRTALPKLLNSGSGVQDQPVVTVYGKTIYRSALNGMLEQRTLANNFMSELNPYYAAQPLRRHQGRDLVDALILQHEADRLGLPGGPRSVASS